MGEPPMSVSAGAGAGAGLTGHSQSGHGDALTGGSCTSEKVMGAAVAEGSLEEHPENKATMLPERTFLLWECLEPAAELRDRRTKPRHLSAGGGKIHFLMDILVCYNSMSQTSPSAFHGAILHAISTATSS